MRVSLRASLRALRPFEDVQSEKTSYIDAILIHIPFNDINDTMQAWRTLESYVPSKIKHLGISNVDLLTLKEVFLRAAIKPSIVQNRFHSLSSYDSKVRMFCTANDIVYQAFWILSANKDLLQSRAILNLAFYTGTSPAAALYALVMSLGIVALNGTTSEQRMKADMADVKCIHEWTESNRKEWDHVRDDFKKILELRDCSELSPP